MITADRCPICGYEHLHNWWAYHPGATPDPGMNEAINVAAQAMRDNNTARAWEDTTPGHVPIAVYAKAAIEAAAPILERQVREKIAREIEALMGRVRNDRANRTHGAYQDAAAIARGTTPHDKTTGLTPADRDAATDDTPAQTHEGADQ